MFLPPDSPRTGLRTPRRPARRRTLRGLATLTAAAAGALVTASEPPPIPDRPDPLLIEARGAFGQLPAPEPSTLTHPAAVLGRALFWDARLSADGRTACASCHLPEDWGADRRRFSPDARGRLTSRNSQTVFNAMQQPFLRWTGDRTSGAHQAEKSVTGSMGFAKAEDVVPLLRRHGYEPAFQRAWPGQPDPITPGHYAQALQTYQESLATPAAFDRFLAGGTNALSGPQRRGLEIFLAADCADCHRGALLGGRTIRKFGVQKPYWTATGSEKRDGGLFETTGREEDRDRFRVSMLRNIARTGPYFHDGSVASLRDAVQVMADVQNGRRLPDADAAAIVAFLETLTGEVPSHYAPPP